MTTPLEPQAGVLAGWKMNHVQPSPDREGVAEIGYLDPEDDRFSPIVTVDTGLYYRPEDAVPLAQQILDAITPPLLKEAPADERARLAAECKRLVEELGKATVKVSLNVTSDNIDALLIADASAKAAIDRLAALQVMSDESQPQSLGVAAAPPGSTLQPPSASSAAIPNAKDERGR